MRDHRLLGLTVTFLDPGNALAALDGWAVAIRFEDGTEDSGVLVDMRHNNSKFGNQLFGLYEVLDPEKEIVRTFIGNVVELTVL